MLLAWLGDGDGVGSLVPTELLVSSSSFCGLKMGLSAKPSLPSLLGETLLAQKGISSLVDLFILPLYR